MDEELKKKIESTFKGVYISDSDNITKYNPARRSSTFPLNSNYNPVLFSWLDINNVTDNFWPRSCRGIFNAIFYNPEIFKSFHYYYEKGFQTRTDFQPDYSKLNILVCCKTSEIDRIKSEIARLNELKSLLDCSEDLIFKEFPEYTAIITSDEKTKEWAAFHLTGPAIYISSPAMTSFITGLVKYRWEGERQRGSVYNHNLLYTSPEKFIQKYRASILYTHNIELIKQIWSINVDQIRDNFSHDLGAQYFYLEDYNNNYKALFLCEVSKIRVKFNLENEDSKENLDFIEKHAKLIEYAG